MLVDKCCCIACNNIYEFDEPVEAGTSLECDNCGRLMKAGPIRLEPSHEGFLLRSVRPPACPRCGSTESRMGRKIGISPALYIRQCCKCHTVWRGNAWYFESQVK